MTKDKSTNPQSSRDAQFFASLKYSNLDRIPTIQDPEVKYLNEQESLIKVSEFLYDVLLNTKTNDASSKVSIHTKFNVIACNTKSGGESVLKPKVVEIAKKIMLVYVSVVILELDTFDAESIISMDFKNPNFEVIENWLNSKKCIQTLTGGVINYKAKYIELHKKYFERRGYIEGEFVYQEDLIIFNLRNWCKKNNEEYPFGKVSKEVKKANLQKTIDSKKAEKQEALQLAFEGIKTKLLAYSNSESSPSLLEYTNDCINISNMGVNGKQSKELVKLKRSINKKFGLISGLNQNNIFEITTMKDIKDPNDRNFE